MEQNEQAAVRMARFLRAGGPLTLLLLLTACEHAVPAALAQPRPARLPPATPAVVEVRTPLPRSPVATPAAHVFALSDQARRFLALQYRSFPTEFMGCMIGAVHGDTVVVDRIAPADVAPAQSTTTWVVPTQTCEGAGWNAVVGMIHSHVGGQRCWYFFPGTAVPSSDAEVFARTGYAVDAIMCGDRVVWMGRRMEQQEVALPTRPSDLESSPSGTFRGWAGNGLTL